MKALELKPTIYLFDTIKEFAADFELNERDLVLTNRWIFDPFLGL